MVIYPETARDLLAIPSFEVAPGGASQHETEFKISRVDADLPGMFDAIIVLGDMQGVDDGNLPVDARQLLGVHVANELGTLCEFDILPESSRVLICLTGDLFTVLALDRRGGTGDVLPVYRAFAAHFPHVLAVAGNHDLFGESTSIATAQKTGVTVLNGTTVDFDGFTVGGICGIDGNNGKVWRNTESDLKKLVRTAATRETDLLLVHEPPETRTFSGSAKLSKFLSRNKFKGVTCCGHKRWKEMFDHAAFGWVANLEGRGVVFARPSLEILL